MSRQTPPRWLLRTLMIILFVPFFAWTLLRRIWIEVRSIPFYVWCDCAEDWSDMREVWRTGSLPDKGDEW